jgi:hypothetical protein
MRALLVLFFTSLALQAPLAWSQNRIPTEILVEELSDEPCGLTKDAISGRARLILRQYGFTETETSNPYFYITVTSFELGQQCVGEITVEVTGLTAQDIGDGKMGWVSKAKGRMTVLARAGYIFSVPRYDASSKILDSVEAQIKNALSEIEY